MSFGITPRAAYKPLGRQPFRPGQWQGYKAGSKHTTYIQNNFFGSGYTSGYNYGNYGSYCNHDNGGLSKGMKWLLGIGIGTTLLGGILKLFGIGGKEEAGAVQTPPPTGNSTDYNVNNDEIVGGNKPPKTATEPEETGASEKPTTTEQPTQSSEIKTNPYDWSKLDNMVCRDASGKTQNISGNINITQKGAEGEAPKEFTITDNSSGTPHTYTYQLAGTTSDGKPIYNCVSMNGQAINGSAQYTLETKADGTPELVQYQNQANFGQGLKFGKNTTNTVSQPAENTTTQTPSTTQTTEVPQTSTPSETQANETTQSTTPTQTQTTEKTQTQPSTTPKATANGKEVGQQVAEDLVGYTKDTEKARTIDNIKNNIDSSNIVDFLNSYKENKGFGDNVIKQINTELGWTNQEKLQAQKKIVQELLNKADSQGIKLDTNTRNYVEKFLAVKDNSSISNTAADNLDKIINKLLDELKEKPGQYGGGDFGGGGAGSSF